MRYGCFYQDDGVPGLQGLGTDNHHDRRDLLKALRTVSSLRLNPEDQKTVRGTVFPRGGQVERMNRTIKEATIKRFQYDSQDQI